MWGGGRQSQLLRDCSSGVGSLCTLMIDPAAGAVGAAGAVFSDTGKKRACNELSSI